MRTVLFDLDGTLLPMDMQAFMKAYLGELAAKAAASGYHPQELVAAVMEGLEAMLNNDGAMTNEERFWQLFLYRCGGEREVHFRVFEDFYSNEFTKLKEVVQPTPLARQAVQVLKAKGYQLVLATNPVFPSIATLTRVGWAGLDPRDFALITTFENSRFSKPNLSYFQDILTAVGAEPQECLMIGNDVAEDLPAAELGMEVFLVTDNLINTRGADFSHFPQGTREDLVAYLTTLPDRM